MVSPSPSMLDDELTQIDTMAESAWSLLYLTTNEYGLTKEYHDAEKSTRKTLCQLSASTRKALSDNVNCIPISKYVEPYDALHEDEYIRMNGNCIAVEWNDSNHLPVHHVMHHHDSVSTNSASTAAAKSVAAKKIIEELDELKSELNEPYLQKLMIDNHPFHPLPKVDADFLDHISALLNEMEPSSNPNKAITNLFDKLNINKRKMGNGAGFAVVKAIHKKKFSRPKWKSFFQTA